MKKVIVGMSGGVDSSVTAALLIQEGYQVEGVFMKNWTKNVADIPCTWQQDYQDALKVAVKLDIKLNIYDFQKDYKKLVVDYMVREYKQGNTPNPDIICNQEIKFKLFLRTALNKGADYIATGHYSQIKKAQLLMAKDISKDQSYFLYRVDKDALNKTLMPIGGLHKSEVRQIAKKLNLPTANKKDSVGICFIGQVSIADFLTEQLGKQKSGLIVDESGKTLGSHNGAIFYTIGQRHGLNIGGGLPYYVYEKDISNNIVFVTNDLTNSNLWFKTINLINTHWLITPSMTKKYKVRLRHLGKLFSAKLKNNEIILDESVRGIAAGQSAVLYDNQKVVGGGIISKVN